jgi:hypothetical protein
MNMLHTSTFFMILLLSCHFLAGQAQNDTTNMYSNLTPHHQHRQLTMMIF